MHFASDVDFLIWSNLWILDSGFDLLREMVI